MAQMALLEIPSWEEIVLVRVPNAQIDNNVNPKTAAKFDAFILSLETVRQI